MLKAELKDKGGAAVGQKTLRLNLPFLKLASSLIIPYILIEQKPFPDRRGQVCFSLYICPLRKSVEKEDNKPLLQSQPKSLLTVTCSMAYSC